MEQYVGQLEKVLARSVRKASKAQKSATGSVAISQSSTYYAGSVASDTHLLDIPSEQLALTSASHNNDFKIEGVLTLSEESAPVVSPIVLKIIADHATRIGRPIGYCLLNEEREVVFQTEDVNSVLPFYASPLAPLTVINDRRLSPSPVPFKGSDELFLLKRHTLEGIKRNFPTSDSASGYGAAVLTEGGMVYFGGQYSSPDKRLGVHAEMGVISRALMEEGARIKAIGVASSKYEEEPCQMCGCCRQFLSEVCERYSIDPTIFCFAASTDAVAIYKIKDLLPNRWTSKKWQP